MKKTTKKKKPSVRKTILDIVTIRSISEKGYYNMDDGQLHGFAANTIKRPD